MKSTYNKRKTTVDLHVLPMRGQTVVCDNINSKNVLSFSSLKNHEGSLTKHA